MVKGLIEDLLEEKFSEPEFQDCFLIDISGNKKRKITVYIDKDNGVDFKTCRQISRFLESHLDERDDVRKDYILEVSSPGADRPLKHPRQYRKHIGRKLSVTDGSGKSVSGKLSEADEQGIVLTEIGKRKESASFRFEDIAEAKVIISFK